MFMDAKYVFLYLKSDHYLWYKKIIKVLKKNVRWGYVDLFLVLFFNLSIRIINLLEPKIDVLLQNFMVASRSHVATQKVNFPLQGVFTNAI